MKTERHEKERDHNQYALQLATTLRSKATELSWLFVESEARLALAREWTEEAQAAGEPEWLRYKDDIAILEEALNDTRQLLHNALLLRS